MTWYISDVEHQETCRPYEFLENGKDRFGSGNHYCSGFFGPEV